MPKLNVLNIQGQNVGEIELSDAVFGVEEELLLHQNQEATDTHYQRKLED